MGPWALPSLKQTLVSLEVHEVVEPPSEPPLPLPLPPVPEFPPLLEEQDTAEAIAPASARAVNRAETLTNIDELMLIPSYVCSFNHRPDRDGERHFDNPTCRRSVRGVFPCVNYG